MGGQGEEGGVRGGGGERLEDRQAVRMSPCAPSGPGTGALGINVSRCVECSVGI